MHLLSKSLPINLEIDSACYLLVKGSSIEVMMSACMALYTLKNAARKQIPSCQIVCE